MSGGGTNTNRGTARALEPRKKGLRVRRSHEACVVRSRSTCSRQTSPAHQSKGKTKLVGQGFVPSSHPFRLLLPGLF